MNIICYVFIIANLSVLGPMDQFIIGHLFEMPIVVIMTVMFYLPLRHTKSIVIRDVIKRTVIGGTLHVLLTGMFIIILKLNIQNVVITITLLCLSGFFPIMFHIALSHRDEKPIVVMASFSLFKKNISEEDNSSPILRTSDQQDIVENNEISASSHHSNIIRASTYSLHGYRQAAMDTFISENNEIKTAPSSLSHSLIDSDQPDEVILK